MAFPVLLRKLFANNGAGPKLREDIIPINDYVTEIIISGATVTIKKKDGTTTTQTTQTYTLPNATSSVLGGVKVGSNITVSSGQISVTKSNVTTALGYTPLSNTGGTVSGNLTVTGTLKGATIQATSDVRLKEDLEAIDGALKKVMNLTPYTYQLKGLDGRHGGLIAQDVQNVLPVAVKKDLTSEDGYLSLDYNAIVALAIGAIKELKAEVEELKNGQRIS